MNTNTKLMIQATRAMKAQDVLHHVAQVSYIITLKTIQMHVVISGSIMIGPCLELARDYTPTSLRKQMGESQLSITAMLN